MYKKIRVNIWYLCIFYFRYEIIKFPKRRLRINKWIKLVNHKNNDYFFLLILWFILVYSQDFFFFLKSSLFLFFLSRQVPNVIFIFINVLSQERKIHKSKSLENHYLSSLLKFYIIVKIPIPSWRWLFAHWCNLWPILCAIDSSYCKFGNHIRLRRQLRFIRLLQFEKFIHKIFDFNIAACRFIAFSNAILQNGLQYLHRSQ